MRKPKVLVGDSTSYIWLAFMRSNLHSVDFHGWIIGMAKKSYWSKILIHWSENSSLKEESASSWKLSRPFIFTIHFLFSNVLQLNGWDTSTVCFWDYGQPKEGLDAYWDLILVCHEYKIYWWPAVKLEKKKKKKKQKVIYIYILKCSRVGIFYGASFVLIINSLECKNFFFSYIHIC